jgi:OHCU decarboxylase
MNGLDRLNALPAAEAEALLLACCGAKRWAAAMAEVRPFPSEPALQWAAQQVFHAFSLEDWLEAFAAHPRIGEPATGWSEEEQSAAATAPSSVLAELAEANQRYEARFGHAFIVYATGKSVKEMLALLRSRLDHEPAKEIAVAAVEQTKITRLRLRKLVRS